MYAACSMLQCSTTTTKRCWRLTQKGVRDSMSSFICIVLPLTLICSTIDKKIKNVFKQHRGAVCLLHICYGGDLGRRLLSDICCRKSWMAVVSVRRECSSLFLSGKWILCHFTRFKTWMTSSLLRIAWCLRCSVAQKRRRHSLVNLALSMQC